VHDVFESILGGKHEIAQRADLSAKRAPTCSSR
jgi:hypothetical protein